MMLRIDILRWFTMAPFWIQNDPQNTKILQIWTKFGFQVDYDVANWYQSLVCYVGHFESKMATNIQKYKIQNRCQQNRQIVNGLRFQWKLIFRNILKWGIGCQWWNLHPHARILIWGSFVDFCVCIQTQSYLVIIIIIIIIIIPLLLLRMNLYNQIHRDWWSDLY